MTLVKAWRKVGPMKLEVFYEATPNPQSLKFVVTANISEESVHFENAQQAQRSPLAAKLFGFPWVNAIFIGSHFITVTKQDWVDWDILADPLTKLIEEHINSDEPVLLPTTGLSVTEDTLALDEVNENDSPIVKQIKQILNAEIRPAVAMDGGDISFHKYENNIVYLSMHGACSGCPSSTMTLKMGIETRLKELIPEIQEVVSL